MLIHHRTGMRIENCNKCEMASIPVDEEGVCLPCLTKPDREIAINKIITSYMGYCICDFEQHFLHKDRYCLICKLGDIKFSSTLGGMHIKYSECIKERSHFLGIGYFSVEEAKGKINLVCDFGREEAECIHIYKHLHPELELSPESEIVQSANLTLVERFKSLFKKKEL